MKLYGIKTCSTVRKARLWLVERAIDHVFHDYRADGMHAVPLASWCARVGWEALLNRSGTTFRGLSEARRTDLDQARALTLMKDQPAMIRRPVLTWHDEILIGFSPERYETFLAEQARVDAR